jgi:hypothetical protein
MKMEYKIDLLGTVFGTQEIQNLLDKMNSNGETGWEFHSVVPITHIGCFGFSKSTAYLAIYQKRQQ